MVFLKLNGCARSPGKASYHQEASTMVSVWATKTETLNLTMANEVAKASTKGQVTLIRLSYPQQSSTQKFISLVPLKLKLILIATVNLTQSDEKKPLK